MTTVTDSGLRFEEVQVVHPEWEPEIRWKVSDNASRFLFGDLAKSGSGTWVFWPEQYICLPFDLLEDIAKALRELNGAPAHS